MVVRLRQAKQHNKHSHKSTHQTKQMFSLMYTRRSVKEKTDGHAFMWANPFFRDPLSQYLLSRLAKRSGQETRCWHLEGDLFLILVAAAYIPNNALKTKLKDPVHRVWGPSGLIVGQSLC
jgi:hypothetical protein